jgi:uncharacterized integral membrane protein
MSEREPTPAEARRATEPPKKEGERAFPLGLVLAGLLLVYGVLFVILNSDEVKVSFVFFSTRISLVVALVLVLVVGFAAGYLVRASRGRRPES